MGVKFSQLPVATELASDDYIAVLDTSQTALKRTSIEHSSDTTVYGLGTTYLYGHNKLIDDLSKSVLASGEVLSAHQGNILANIMGKVEIATAASFAHSVGEYFIFKGQYVKCTSAISAGSNITIGSNVQLTTIGAVIKAINAEIAQMKVTFQDGVDTIYNACIQNGLTPSASTPQAIASAISGSKKVVNLGSGTSFNVTSYPNYRNFTVNNFYVVCTALHGSYSGGYAQTPGYLSTTNGYAQGGSNNTSFDQAISKSYNSSTGIFTVGNTWGQSPQQSIWAKFIDFSGEVLGEGWNSGGERRCYASVDYNVLLIY